MDHAAEAAGALEEVRRQRGNVAARVRLPTWYLVVWGLGAFAMTVTPILQTRWSATGVSLAVMLPAILVVCSFEWMVRQVSGLRLSRRTMLAYPSTRPQALIMGIGIIGGLFGAQFLDDAGRFDLAVVVAVSGAALAAGGLMRMTEAVRRDIREGRARAV